MEDKPGVQTPTQLVDDLINDIINRLPAISNFRFKCVSKQWFFQNSEALKRKSERPTMSGIFCVPKNLTLVEYVKMQKDHNEDSSIDETLSFLPEITHMTIYDSCGGLLLCSDWDECNSCFYVCNPATRKWVRIPYKCNGLILDAILDFNHLVSVYFNIILITYGNGSNQYNLEYRNGSNQYNLEAFSLETGNWKMVSQVEVDLESALLFKGLIYVINREHICGYDMEGNLCRRIEHPVSHWNRFSSIGLDQSGGYLHYYYNDKSEVYVWKLVDYESGSWLLKTSFQVMNPERIISHPDEDDVVFVCIRDRWHSYNMQTSQMIEICSGVDLYSFFPYSPCYLDWFGNEAEGEWIRE